MPELRLEYKSDLRLMIMITAFLGLFLTCACSQSVRDAPDNVSLHDTPSRASELKNSDIQRLRGIAIRTVQKRLSDDLKYNVFYEFPTDDHILFILSPQQPVFDGVFTVKISIESGEVLEIQP